MFIEHCRVCPAGAAEMLGTPDTIPEAEEEPRHTEQQERDQLRRGECPSDVWRRLQSQTPPALAVDEPGGSRISASVIQAPTVVSRV